MLAQAARLPPHPPLVKRRVVQVVFIRLCNQKLRLLRQARHVHDARRPGSDAVTIATCASTHEAFSRAPMDGLRADVARLTFCVLRARLDGDGDGLRAFRVCVILFGATASLNFLAELVMAAFLPVFLLARRATVTRGAAAAFLPRS